MLSVSIEVVKIKAAIISTGIFYSVSRIFKRFLVCESIKIIAIVVFGDGKVSIEIPLGMSGMSDSDPFYIIGILDFTIGVEGRVGRFMCDVPGEGITMKNLPFILVVHIITGLAPTSARGANKVEVLGHEAWNIGKNIAGFGVTERSAVMRHDIVKIDFDAKPVGDFDE